MNGAYGGVSLGSPASVIRERFGTPAGGDGFFPEGERFRGPPSVRSPTGAEPLLLRYEEAAFLAATPGGVFALVTTNEGDETRRGVKVGDALGRVRERYERVKCGKSVAGEPLFGDEVPMYRWCRTRVGDVDVFFGDDPIEAITLTRAGLS